MDFSFFIIVLNLLKLSYEFVSDDCLNGIMQVSKQEALYLAHLLH